MKAWGCITANGNILPRTIRASEGEVDLVMGKEPLARMVVMLDVRINKDWAESVRQRMLRDQARGMA